MTITLHYFHSTGTDSLCDKLQEQNPHLQVPTRPHQGCKCTITSITRPCEVQTMALLSTTIDNYVRDLNGLPVNPGGSSDGYIENGVEGSGGVEFGPENFRVSIGGGASRSYGSGRSLEWQQSKANPARPNEWQHHVIFTAQVHFNFHVVFRCGPVNGPNTTYHGKAVTLVRTRQVGEAMCPVSEAKTCKPDYENPGEQPSDSEVLDQLGLPT